MSDFIKREDAISELVTITNESDMPEDWHRGLSVAISNLFRVPSADVAEVVRCKDCKQFEKHSGHIGNIQYNGYCKGIGDWVNPTDYCSWGERKDNEYELAIEQLQHDMAFEPTFNSEDGSM